MGNDQTNRTYQQILLGLWKEAQAEDEDPSKWGDRCWTFIKADVDKGYLSVAARWTTRANGAGATVLRLIAGIAQPHIEYSWAVDTAPHPLRLHYFHKFGVALTLLEAMDDAEAALIEAQEWVKREDEAIERERASGVWRLPLLGGTKAQDVERELLGEIEQAFAAAVSTGARTATLTLHVRSSVMTTTLMPYLASHLNTWMPQRLEVPAFALPITVELDAVEGFILRADLPMSGPVTREAWRNGRTGGLMRAADREGFIDDLADLIVTARLEQSYLLAAKRRLADDLPIVGGEALTLKKFKQEHADAARVATFVNNVVNLPARAATAADLILGSCFTVIPSPTWTQPARWWRVLGVRDVQRLDHEPTREFYLCGLGLTGHPSGMEHRFDSVDGWCSVNPSLLVMIAEPKAVWQLLPNLTAEDALAKKINDGAKGAPSSQGGA